MENNKMMTVKNLMDEWQIGRSKAYELCNQPDFPVIRLGRKVLISVDGLTEWMKKHEGKVVDPA